MKDFIKQSLSIIGRAVTETGKEYFTNVTSLVNDAKEVRENVMGMGKTVNQLYVKLRRTNLTKKVNDWFYEKESEFDFGSNEEFDPGFKSPDSDGESSEKSDTEELTAEIESASKTQTKAIYEAAHKQTEQSLINTAEIITNHNARASEMLVAVNNLNKTVIGISEKMDKLLELQGVAIKQEQEQHEKEIKALINSEGHISLAGIYQGMLNGVQNGEMGSNISMFREMIPMLAGQMGPVDAVKLGLSHFTDKKLSILDDQSIDDIGHKLNNAIGNATDEIFTKLIDNKRFREIFGDLDKLDNVTNYKDKIVNTYTTNKATFDGMTRLSIVSIIPAYLRKITEGITGQSWVVNNTGQLQLATSNTNQPEFQKVTRSAFQSTGFSSFTMSSMHKALGGDTNLKKEDLETAAKAFMGCYVMDCHDRNVRALSVNQLGDINSYGSRGYVIIDKAANMLASTAGGSKEYWRSLCQTVALRITTNKDEGADFVRAVNQNLQSMINEATTFAKSGSAYSNQAGKISFSMMHDQFGKSLSSDVKRGVIYQGEDPYAEFREMQNKLKELSNASLNLAGTNLSDITKQLNQIGDSTKNFGAASWADTMKIAHNVRQFGNLMSMAADNSRGVGFAKSMWNGRKEYGLYNQGDAAVLSNLFGKDLEKFLEQDYATSRFLKNTKGNLINNPFDAIRNKSIFKDQNDLNTLRDFAGRDLEKHGIDIGYLDPHQIGRKIKEQNTAFFKDLSKELKDTGKLFDFSKEGFANNFTFSNVKKIADAGKGLKSAIETYKENKRMTEKKFTTNDYIRGIFGILNRGINVRTTNYSDDVHGYSKYDVKMDEMSDISGQSNDNSTLKGIFSNAFTNSKNGLEFANNFAKDSGGWIGTKIVKGVRNTWDRITHSSVGQSDKDSRGNNYTTHDYVRGMFNILNRGVNVKINNKWLAGLGFIPSTYKKTSLAHSDVDTQTSTGNLFDKGSIKNEGKDRALGPLGKTIATILGGVISTFAVKNIGKFAMKGFLGKFLGTEGTEDTPITADQQTLASTADNMKARAGRIGDKLLNSGPAKTVRNFINNPREAVNNASEYGFVREGKEIVRQVIGTPEKKDGKYTGNTQGGVINNMKSRIASEIDERSNKIFDNVEERIDALQSYNETQKLRNRDQRELLNEFENERQKKKVKKIFDQAKNVTDGTDREKFFKKHRKTLLGIEDERLRSLVEYNANEQFNASSALNKDGGKIGHILQGKDGNGGILGAIKGGFKMVGGLLKNFLKALKNLFFDGARNVWYGLGTMKEGLFGFKEKDENGNIINQSRGLIGDYLHDTVNMYKGAGKLAGKGVRYFGNAVKNVLTTDLISMEDARMDKALRAAGKEGYDLGKGVLGRAVDNWNSYDRDTIAGGAHQLIEGVKGSVVGEGVGWAARTGYDVLTGNRTLKSAGSELKDKLKESTLGQGIIGNAQDSNFIQGILRAMPTFTKALHLTSLENESTKAKREKSEEHAKSENATWLQRLGVKGAKQPDGLLSRFGKGFTSGFEKAREAKRKAELAKIQVTTYTDAVLSGEKDPPNSPLKHIINKLNDINEGILGVKKNTDQEGNGSENPEENNTNNVEENGIQTSTTGANDNPENTGSGSSGGTAEIDSSKNQKTMENAEKAVKDATQSSSSGSNEGGTGGRPKKGGIKGIVSGIGDKLKMGFENLGKTMGGFMQVLLGIGQMLISAVTALSGFQALIDLVSSILSDGVKPLNRLFNQVIRVIRPIVNVVKSVLHTVADLVTDIATSIIDTIQPLLELITPIINDIFSTILKPLYSLISGLSESVIIPALSAIVDSIEPVIVVISDTLQVVAGILQMIVGGIEYGIGAILTGIGGIVKFIGGGDSLTENGSQLMDSGKSYIENGAQLTKQGWNAIWPDIKAIFPWTDEAKERDKNKSYNTIEFPSRDPVVTGGSPQEGMIYGNSNTYNSNVYYQNQYGSGNSSTVMSQYHYGAEYGDHGCGPVALADAYARRTGNSLNPLSLSSMMEYRGSGNGTNIGTSVGTFMNASRSLGMNVTAGGVDTRSIRRASPNNPITLFGSGGGYGTKSGNNHYVNVIGNDSYGFSYVSNPMTGRVSRTPTGQLVANTVLGLYGSGDTGFSSDMLNSFLQSNSGSANIASYLSTLRGLSLSGLFDRIVGKSTEADLVQSMRDNEKNKYATKNLQNKFDDEEWQSYYNAAREAFEKENPKYDGETDQQYEIRWQNSTYKYLKQVGATDAAINGIQDQIDSQKLAADEFVSDYEANKAGIKRASDSIMENGLLNKFGIGSYNTGSATYGRFVGGTQSILAVNYDGSKGGEAYDYKPSVLETQIGKLSSDLQFPYSNIHEFFYMTTKDQGVTKVSTPDDGWWGKKQSPNTKGEGKKGDDSEGIDILFEGSDNPTIRATTDGVVKAAKDGGVANDRWSNGGLGNYVQIVDADQNVHWYTHLKDTPLVKEGQEILGGQPIGLVGSTGNVNKNTLHYQINKTLNPDDYDFSVLRGVKYSFNPMEYFQLQKIKMPGLLNSSIASQMPDVMPMTFTKGTAGIMGGTSSGGSSSGTGRWIDALNKVIHATDEAGYHTYSQSAYLPITVDGKTIKSRIDCTGMYRYAMDYLGYDVDNINAARLRERAESGMRYPVTRGGQESKDWIAMRYAGIGKEGILPGDILVKKGHGEVGYGLVDGQLKGWNFGNPNDILKTQKGAGRMLNGESIATVMKDMPTLGGGYNYVIRPVGITGATTGNVGASIATTGATDGAEATGSNTGKLTKSDFAANSGDEFTNAFKLYAGKNFDEYLTTAKSVGYTAPETALVLTMQIHEDGAEKLTGKKPLTYIVSDKVGQKAYGLMNWIPPKNGTFPAGHTLSEQLRYIKSKYFDANADHEWATIHKSNWQQSKAAAEKAMGHAYVLQPGQKYGTYLSTDLVEGTMHYVANALQPSKSWQQAGYMGGYASMVVDAYNWLLGKGFKGGQGVTSASTATSTSTSTGSSSAMAGGQIQLIDDYNPDDMRGMWFMDYVLNVPQSYAMNSSSSPVSDSAFYGSDTASGSFLEGVASSVPGFTNSALADTSYLITNRSGDNNMHSGPRPGPITKMTWHTWANSNGDKLDDLKNTFAHSADKVATTNANGRSGVSATYGVDGSGNIGLFVDEGNIPHTSSSPENDEKAVTIEIANLPEAYTRYKSNHDNSWEISDAAMEAAKNLTVDVALRNGIPKFEYTGNKNGSWTYHRMFTDKSCPGDYIVNQTDSILADINSRIANSSVISSSSDDYSSSSYSSGSSGSSSSSSKSSSSSSSSKSSSGSKNSNSLFPSINDFTVNRNSTQSYNNWNSGYSGSSSSNGTGHYRGESSSSNHQGGGSYRNTSSSSTINPIATQLAINTAETVINAADSVKNSYQAAYGIGKAAADIAQNFSEYDKIGWDIIRDGVDTLGSTAKNGIKGLYGNGDFVYDGGAPIPQLPDSLLNQDTQSRYVQPVYNVYNLQRNTEKQDELLKKAASMTFNVRAEKMESLLEQLLEEAKKINNKPSSTTTTSTASNPFPNDSIPDQVVRLSV